MNTTIVLEVRFRIPIAVRDGRGLESLHVIEVSINDISESRAIAILNETLEYTRSVDRQERTNNHYQSRTSKKVFGRSASYRRDSIDIAPSMACTTSQIVKEGRGNSKAAREAASCS